MTYKEMLELAHNEVKNGKPIKGWMLDLLIDEAIDHMEKEEK